MKTVYHVSPVSDMKKIHPVGSNRGHQSVNMHQAGVFVSPRFRDAVMWAVSYVSGKDGNRYQNLTIYRLEISEEILKRSWSSTDWEREYFINEEDAKQIKMVGKKTYSVRDLSKLCTRHSVRRNENHWRDARGIAEQIRNTNLAAKEWLRLTDELSDARLKQSSRMLKKRRRTEEKALGRLGMEKSRIRKRDPPRNALEAATDALKRMQKEFFYKDDQAYYWSDQHSLKQRLTKKETEKIKEVVNFVEQLIRLVRGESEFAWEDINIWA